MKIVKVLNENNEWIRIGSLNENSNDRIFNRCYNIALKYETMKEFKKEKPSTYKTAKLHNWLKYYDWLNRAPAEWTYDECLFISKKYETLEDFMNENSSAYIAARENGWLKEFIWLKSSISSWTYAKCYNEALKYKTLQDFIIGNSYAYSVSCENDWLKDFDWLKRGRPVNNPTKWTYDACYNEAKKYNTWEDFKNNSPYVYELTGKRCWHDQYTWLKSDWDTDEDLEDLDLKDNNENIEKQDRYKNWYSNYIFRRGKYK